jgi:hypothetical protein
VVMEVSYVLLSRFVVLFFAVGLKLVSVLTLMSATDLVGFRKGNCGPMIPQA